jgi:hypothetical protein
MWSSATGRDLGGHDLTAILKSLQAASPGRLHASNCYTHRSCSEQAEETGKRQEIQEWEEYKDGPIRQSLQQEEGENEKMTPEGVVAYVGLHL